MIKELLDRYLLAFEEEKDRVKPLSDLLAAVDETEARSRSRTAGHITASGFIISTDRRRVLRFHHAKLNALLQPGGHIEANDATPLAAARREIREETHLTALDHIAFHPDSQVPIDIDIHVIPATGSEPEHLHYDFRFLFVCRDESQLNFAEGEEYEWHNIAALMKDKTFESIKPKIERALSNEFRSKLFFDRMIDATNPAVACQSIVVAHIVPDANVFLRALNLKAPILTAIPKPKSKNDAVVADLKKDFPIDDILTREQIAKQPDCICKLISRSDRPCALFDIGGYFAPVINQLADRLGKKLLGVIEDTENGHQKYEEVGSVKVPVISVARSPLKQNEDFLVGQSIVFSADAILRDVGFNIEYQTCAVFGYGKIGSSIAQHLLIRGVKPMVYDTKPIRRIAASNRMCLIPSRDEILKNADVIFCATGNRVLGKEEFARLKPGCVVCSVTSHDDELDLSSLGTFTKEVVVEGVVEKFTSFGNYFYLLNRGNAVNFVHKAALGSYIHLVRAEMMYALNKLASGTLKPELQCLGEDDRKVVAEAWLEVYADSPSTHNDLGIAG